MNFKSLSSTCFGISLRRSSGSLKNSSRVIWCMPLTRLWNRAGKKELYIGLFCNPLPVEKSVNRNIVLGAPVFDSESALALFVEQGGSFGRICLVHSLIDIHENTSCMSCLSRTSCATLTKFLE